MIILIYINFKFVIHRAKEETLESQEKGQYREEYMEIQGKGSSGADNKIYSNECKEVNAVKIRKNIRF